MHFPQFCSGQKADSICGLNTVKPRPPQSNAVVSPRLISAAVKQGRSEDYNRLLLALFQEAPFLLEHDNETGEYVKF